MVRIINKISNDYGYNVYADRKKCVGLCGDLMARYEEEKNIMQMLFHAGLGEVLNDVPFKSEEELNMGLFRIDKFLQKLSIDQIARRNVLEIFGLAFVDNNGVFKPVALTSFSKLPFKMTIPEATEYSERVSLKFKFMSKTGGTTVDSLLERCVITDKVNAIHESDENYIFIPYAKTKNVEIDVPYGQNKKSLLFNGAKFEFIFLCTDLQRIHIVYTADSSRKLTFKCIEIHKMSKVDKERLDEIVRSSLSPINPPPPIDSPPIDPLPDIRKFSDALSKEIMFLKQGKGKKYKIVNGVKINKDKGFFTYTFEMETELHLPDDAPIVIDTSAGYRAIGSVLHCDDFQIMLLIDRDINDKVLSAYLMVEPWKLLESLNNKMTSLNPNINKLAVKLIEDGPGLGSTQDISAVPTGQESVDKQLKNNDIVTVWGPPGTGKTYTMARIATKYLKAGKSVLIVSHSNVSVDGVIKSVVLMIQQYESDMNGYLEAGKVLRFGYVRDEELSKHPYATSFNYALGRCPGLAKDLEVLSKKRDELKAKNQTKTPEYDDIEKRIKKVRDDIRKEERRYVEKAQLIGTTISRATIDPMFEERQFDLVMFDEVSMAYVPQVIVAASLAKEKFMCVGDFRQLSPIAQNPASKQILQVDIFSYLKIVDGRGNMYWHPWLVMLNEQRRMHPAISEFPNKYVYRNLLKDHPSLEKNRDDIITSEPLSGDALNLINMSGTYCAAAKDSNNSRFNILSAIVSFATAVKAEQNGINTIGIITPYAAQTRLIRAMLHDYYDQGTTVISCATVHQFQGSESDELIFDVVESYPGNKVGFLMGKVPNEILRLINVAITRARGKVITVANARFWENTFKGTNHIYYRFLQHINNGHKVINQKEKTLKPYIESVNPGKMINIFTDEVSALSIFEKDMNRAKGKVVISIPDGRLRETEPKVMDIIDDTYRRGVAILMKSNNYKDLPDTWKEYCFGTENAVFPLVIIDEETAWYGLPTSRLSFKVNETTSYNTVLQLMIRIKGRNTIEMIRALTDIEMIAVGSNKRPLVMKKGKGSFGGGGTGTHGFSTFIEQKEFCPECKSKMILTKNQKGTSYLKCSNKNCKGMKYLSKDLINWYITSKNITCPSGDGGELTGGVGQYGPYVRCSEGHFLKPESI